MARVIDSGTGGISRLSDGLIGLAKDGAVLGFRVVVAAQQSPSKEMTTTTTTTKNKTLQIESAIHHHRIVL